MRSDNSQDDQYTCYSWYGKSWPCQVSPTILPTAAPTASILVVQVIKAVVFKGKSTTPPLSSLWYTVHWFSLVATMDPCCLRKQQGKIRIEKGKLFLRDIFWQFSQTFSDLVRKTETVCTGDWVRINILYITLSTSSSGSLPDFKP